MSDMSELKESLTKLMMTMKHEGRFCLKTSTVKFLGSCYDRELDYFMELHGSMEGKLCIYMKANDILKELHSKIF